MGNRAHKTILASQSRIVLAIQGLLLRTQRTPLRRLVELVYRGIARTGTAYLTRGDRDAATYVRGSLGTDDFVPGLSDIDVAVIVVDDPRTSGRAGDLARLRWQRLRRALPVADLLFDWPRIYDDTELRCLAAASAFTYGLDEAGEPEPRRAGYFGERSSLDGIRMLERPGLYGATADWRPLSGTDRRPRDPERDTQDRRIAAWLELLHWWRLFFPFCADTTTPRAADLCVKLVAEPARIWLWLAYGERVAGRADALKRALHVMPEEQESLRGAFDLQRALPGSPETPLAELLPASVRLSSRIAALIGAKVERAGATEVRLAGDPAELVVADRPQPARPPARGARRTLPLADWRSLACPELPDEAFAPLAGDPGDPAALASAASSHPVGPYPALLADDLMVMPGIPLRRTRLRAIKCPAADPIPFALVAGAEIAAFPNVRGWSAADTARRAVAEHRAWLRACLGKSEEGALTEAPRHKLGMLLTAARAALFLESVQGGDPELCLTVAETARRLAAPTSAARAVADEALGRYRELALHGAEPPAETISALRELVLELPQYR